MNIILLPFKFLINLVTSVISTLFTIFCLGVAIVGMICALAVVAYYIAVIAFGASIVFWPWIEHWSR